MSFEAKENLRKIAAEADKRLERYWDGEIAKNEGEETNQKSLIKKVLEHAKEHNLRSAKRLRASLVYYGYLLGRKEVGEEIWKVMEGVELVQTALLMHDDFMDRDQLRRGLPTTQVHFGKDDLHYGDSMAVSVGDVVLCLGYERVLECGLDKNRVISAGRELMRGITRTALGQIYDITLPKEGSLTEEKVLAIHRTKTSFYTFQNPLVIGAILAGLSGDYIEVLKEYSRFGGVAFQLQDDVLGVFGEADKTGKSTNSDLLQGKSTLLVAKTLELGSEKQRRALLAAWGNEDATEEQIKDAKEAIKESGSLDYSLEMARGLAKQAVVAAEKLRSTRTNKEAVDYLVGIAEYLVERET